MKLKVLKRQLPHARDQRVFTRRIDELRLIPETLKRICTFEEVELRRHRSQLSPKIFVLFVPLCGLMMSSMFRRFALALLLIFAFEAVIFAQANYLARNVTIYRDTYGVPHIFGKSDASTAYGFAYAQAEDNFWRVEENFIFSLGRSAELYGEKTL